MVGRAFVGETMRTLCLMRSSINQHSVSKYGWRFPKIGHLQPCKKASGLMVKVILRQLALLICLSVLLGLVLAATKIIDHDAFLVVVTCNAFVGVMGMLVQKWFSMD